MHLGIPFETILTNEETNDGDCDRLRKTQISTAIVWKQDVNSIS